MNLFLKIILVILVLCITAIVAIGGICYFTFNDLKMQLNETNPIAIEQKAKSIINYKLPEGYKLTNAFNFYGTKAATFKYGPTSQSLYIGSPGELGNSLIKIDEASFKSEIAKGDFEKTAKEEFEKIAMQQGSNNNEIKDFKIINTGILPTATRGVFYVMGKTTLKDKYTGKEKQFEGVVSVFTTSDKQNMIMVSGNKPETFDFEATKAFIKTLEVK